jgi:SAM-dependent methyltransferase
VSTPLIPLDIAEAAYDFVFCRGVFFFLDEKGALLAELYRVVAPGGSVFAGGGFGSHTPKAIIDLIADESRRLNYALGKKMVTRQEFRALLRGNAITADVLDDGGLWAVMKK